MIDQFDFRLPAWIKKRLYKKESVYHTIEERMNLAIQLAYYNVKENTGGPFGTAIFEKDTGKLVSVGINFVVEGASSMLHAEIISIMLAQKRLGQFSLNNQLIKYELVSSVEPCAMCLGAIPWSGVKRLICGARQEDAEAVGFDEGAKPVDWLNELKKRSIDVIQDVLREQAADVLRFYKAQGGIIYNGNHT